MNKSIAMLVSTLAAAGVWLASTGTLHAQDATVNCPKLPSTSTMHWEAMVTGDLVFCRAVAADGGEQFAVTISAESPFKPRSSNRAERGSVGGVPLQWYRAEIAARPDERAREALVELGNGRVAHISLRAGSDDELQRIYANVSELQFPGVRITAN